MTPRDKLVTRLQIEANIPPWVFERSHLIFGDDLLMLTQRLVDDKWIDHGIAADAYAEQLGFAYVSLEQTLFQSEALALIPHSLAAKYNVIPLYKLGESLTVSTAHPENIEMLNELAHLINISISPVFALPSEIQHAILVHYRDSAALNRAIDKANRLFFIPSEQRDVQAAHQALCDIYDGLIIAAIAKNVDDIQLEPRVNRVELTYRINGVETEQFLLSKEVGLPLIDHIKGLAHIDTRTDSLPQFGSLEYNYPTKHAVLHISTLHAHFGELLAIRLVISDNRVTKDKKQDVTFLKDTQKLVDDSLHKVGMFVITGPPNAGKISTLYEVLNLCNVVDRPPIVIESELDHEESRFTQISTQRLQGEEYASVVQEILRHSFRLIGVSEIDCRTTAQAVVQAALAGRQIITTLHAEGAIAALIRLLDYGITPSSLMHATSGILAQRHVRAICPYCKESKFMSSDYFARYFHWNEETVLPPLYHGKGCDNCHGSGFLATVCLYEFLSLDYALISAARTGYNLEELTALAQHNGFKEFQYDGLRKALLGLTTIEEVMRVVPQPTLIHN